MITAHDRLANEERKVASLLAFNRRKNGEPPLKEEVVVAEIVVVPSEPPKPKPVLAEYQDRKKDRKERFSAMFYNILKGRNQ